MTDRIDFEARLEERLRARAALASRPFDPGAIAGQAILVGGRRSRMGGLAWPSSRSARLWLAVALVGVALAAAAAVGALIRERSRVPQGPASNGWIAVSANPGTIGGGEYGDIYIVDEGASARRIIGALDDGIAQACPRFSPDGERLAYGEARASESVTNNHDNWPVRDRAVVIVGIDDSGQPTEPILRVAVDASAGVMPCPEWSPDGRYVAFRHAAELWIADTASGQTTVFPVVGVRSLDTDEGGNLGYRFHGFAWSRDGSRIAVPEVGNIRIVNVGDGSARLIPIDGESNSVVWTANDARIAYLGGLQAGGEFSVHLVDAGGTNSVEISPDVPGLDDLSSNLAVSPDGNRLAFVQRTISCGDNGCGPDEPRLLIAEPDRATVVEVSLPESGHTLVWSPDGNRLLFGGFDEVRSIALESGSPPIVYTSGKLNLEWSDWELTWQPVFEDP